MISYETYCKILDYSQRQRLSAAQIALKMGLDPRTVGKWLNAGAYQLRQSTQRSSKLDSFKSSIVRLLETHPYSATQVFQRIREAGYDGGYTVVKDYVRIVRPVRQPAFLTLSFEPGECAQVDWGLCRARHKPHYADIRTMLSRFSSLVQHSAYRDR